MSQYTIPSVVERRAGGGERVVDVFSRLLSERIVYLGTEIDDGVANVLVAQLLHLESENPDAPISLYINSPGGSASAALAVYDAMQYVRPPVATTCVGQAASPAALLLAGGEPGQRAILSHGRVVLHQPSAEGRGTLPDLIVAADEVARLRAELEEVLSRHTGKGALTIRQDTDRDLVLTAEQAVSYGVADLVVRGRAPRPGTALGG
ncbi:ATP-dependent Clp protease proteolytic subunit [Actinotalea sp. BY-33]|uniref:ATP-dependent Clp protease proteolytic subunit n=1 Tax=Actinotalea soli TaxID=2819234 RepID=A0A939RSM0_9CELL|nr:ATP-dependent Clp protease proteolytic subunit [Actinotalea soli]MBO1751777.1 ATP-dependent Clp protease proteolytic subunit [Actinotalea soli]